MSFRFKIKAIFKTIVTDLKTQVFSQCLNVCLIE